VLTRSDLAALANVAVTHDLWILCDEVYEEMVFEGTDFASPLDDPTLAERVVVASSISKSHAAPGFRSGWCIGPSEFCTRLLLLSETMLFGSQPFIADMTAMAVSAPSPVAAGMATRFKRRAGLIADLLDGRSGLRVNRPEAGMFALVDIGITGVSGDVFAMSLLEDQKVAVMPGESFGVALAGWVRLSLTQDDTRIAEACARILRHVQGMKEKAA
jgi:arginine:pyruvate transaminase